MYLQVPLGVLLHNENKSVDMIKIVNHLHQYVLLVEHKVDVLVAKHQCRNSRCLNQVPSNSSWWRPIDSSASMRVSISNG